MLNGNASAGTLSSFIAVLNVLKCYVAQFVSFSTLKKINREFVNKKVFLLNSFL